MSNAATFERNKSYCKNGDEVSATCEAAQGSSVDSLVWLVLLSAPRKIHISQQKATPFRKTQGREPVGEDLTHFTQLAMSPKPVHQRLFFLSTKNHFWFRKRQSLTRTATVFQVGSCRAVGPTTLPGRLLTGKHLQEASP